MMRGAWPVTAGELLTLPSCHSEQVVRPSAFDGNRPRDIDCLTVVKRQ